MIRSLVALVLPMLLFSQEDIPKNNLESRKERKQESSYRAEQAYITSYAITSTVILTGLAYCLIRNRKRDPKEGYYDNDF